MRKGVALITVILITAFLFVIAALTIFLVQRSTHMAGVSRRYLSTFEVAEGGVDAGVNEVERAYEEGERPSDLSQTVNDFANIVNINVLFVTLAKGGSIEFAAGYEGIGKGAQSGGAAIFYRILSDARGKSEERVQLEVIYRKVIGIVAK